MLLACASGLLAAAEAPPPRAELPPLGLPFTLVAGNGEPGHQDGAFEEAEFSAPGGMALDGAHRLLYLADTGNNAIRVIDLGNANAVSTLCGGGAAGDQDGSGSARLSGPTRVALWPEGGSLLFVDQNGGAVRRADLTGGKTTTLPPALPPGKPQPFYSLLISDGAGHFLVADADNQELRILNPYNGSQIPILANPFFGARALEAVVLRHQLKAYDPNGGRLLSLDLTAWSRIPVSPTAADLGRLPAVQPFLEPAKTGGMGLLPLPLPQGGVVKFFTWMPHADRLVNVGLGAQEKVELYGMDGQNSDTAPPAQSGVPSLPSTYYGRLSPPLNLCLSPDGASLYVSVLNGNLVAQVDLRRQDFDYNISECALAPKAAGTERLLFVGHSLLTWGTDQDGVLPRRQWFPERFEQFMNLKRTLRGCGAALDVEVLQTAGPHFPGSAIGSVRQLAPLAAKSQVDELVVVVDQRALAQEALGAFRNTSHDDLADVDFDPEWQETPESGGKFASLGPLTRQLYAIWRRDPARFHGALEKGPLGVDVDFDHDEYAFEDPGVRDLEFGVILKALASAAEAAKQNGLRLRIVLVPIDKQFPDVGSLCADRVSEGLAEACGRLGIPFLNMIPALRTLDLTLFPFYANWHHLFSRGHDWWGWALAEIWDDPCRPPYDTRHEPDAPTPP